MRDDEKERIAEEASWSRWRSSMTLIANIYRDKKVRPNPFMPQEFVKLSFDDDVSRDAHAYHPPTPEFIDFLKKRFGSTIKKKLNGRK